MLSQSSAAVMRSTITKCTAQGRGAQGGAFHLRGKSILDLTDGSIDHCVAHSTNHGSHAQGGALHLAAGSTSRMESTSIGFCSARVAWEGSAPDYGPARGLSLQSSPLALPLSPLPATPSRRALSTVPAYAEGGAISIADADLTIATSIIHNCAAHNILTPGQARGGGLL